ncbi:MAG TPA: urate hydroxylase PuuD [Caulobacteraceae bacterium]|nr:urate hydroxylase PuuD [Caulobacteraceae bacterium]
MSAILLNFRNTMIVAFLLAIVMLIAFARTHGAVDMIFWQAVARWLHVFFGILWIGLLYYFNFVAARKTPEIPAELRPALTKYITPEALFWFRWSALGTVVMGVIVALLRGGDYAAKVFTFGFAGGYGPEDRGFTLMGIGVYLALIMFLNVWGIIWPNQKIVLGMKEADDAAKTRAARIASLASRTNTLLSVPMLTAMAMYQTLFG